MKKVLIFLFLMILISLNAINDQLVNSIFDKCEKSVVYIEESIYFDSSNLKYKDYFSKFEKENNFDILDKYLFLSSGSGFFVSEDGVIITNNHVVNVLENENNKKKFLSNIKDFYNKNSSIKLTYTEFEKMFNELSEKIKKSKIIYRVLVNNKDYYEAKVLDFDKNLDIAILKIEGSNYKVLKIGNSDTLRVGNSVIAIGYPMNNNILKIVKDNKSTVTVGTISALRNDNFGIQHSAPINPGNSGGPLINEKSEVIGINSRVLYYTSNIGFSIPTKILLKYLNTKKYQDIITKNKDYKLFNDDLTSDFKNEIGQNIFIDLDSSYNVFINDKMMGNAPFLIKSFNENTINLRVESDKDYAENKYTINKSLTTNFIYKPALTEYLCKINLDSSIKKSDIYIDEIFVGKTPFLINNLSIGKHKIVIESDGYASITDEVTLIKNKTLEKKYELKKGYSIKFNQKLPDDTKITVIKDNQKYSYKALQNLHLESGIWNVNLESVLFKENEKIIVTINDKDINIDIYPKYVTTKIVFENLKKDSLVFIDDLDKTSDVKNNSIDIPIGNRWIVIKLKNYKNIIIKAELFKDKTKTIKLKYEFET